VGVKGTVVKESMKWAVVACAMSVMASALGNDAAKQPLPLEALLKQTVEVSNGQLPVMLDKNTELTRLSYQGKKLIYHYKFVNVVSGQLNPETLQKQLAEASMQQVCTVPNFKPILDGQGVVAFQYSGTDNKPVLELSFDKESCGQ